ncbi:MAG: hypothetical protein WCT02_01060 [Candidatus Paceibacterota bacterium]
MGTESWQDRAFNHDMKMRGQRHQEGLNTRASEATMLKAEGFELVDEVEIILHANESNAVRIVIGHIIKDKRGEMLFRDRGSNKNRKYDPGEIEKFKEKRLEELENS